MPHDRRGFLTLSLASAGVAALLPVGASAESPIDIDWSDLVPESGGTAMDALRELGIVQHGQLTTPWDQELGGQVTDEYDGLLVRIPGYLVPLDFSGKGVTAALLVPYVGACIHVPPPPPNQLIFLTAKDPYRSGGLFEAVYVTGLFGAAATGTELAEVGYAMSESRIEPYS